jgi:hypothetical protein
MTKKKPDFTHYPFEGQVGGSGGGVGRLGDGGFMRTKLPILPGYNNSAGGKKQGLEVFNGNFLVGGLGKITGKFNCEKRKVLVGFRVFENSH